MQDQRGSISTTPGVLRLRPKHDHFVLKKLPLQYTVVDSLNSQICLVLPHCLLSHRPFFKSKLCPLMYIKPKKRIDLWRFQREGFWNGMLHFDVVLKGILVYITAWCSPSLWQKLYFKLQGFWWWNWLFEMYLLFISLFNLNHLSKWHAPVKWRLIYYL